MGCGTALPEKYTNITEGGDGGAALWQVLTTAGGLAGVEESRYALPSSQPGVPPNGDAISYGYHDGGAMSVVLQVSERAWRCWGLCRHRHLLRLKVHVRIPALKNGAQLPVQRSYARLQ